MNSTKEKIISSAITAVRQYGLEGVRIQNISDLAGITPGAVYRHFKGKEELLIECFTYVDKQAADIFNQIKYNFGLIPRMKRYFITDFGTAPSFMSLTKAGT